MRCKFTLSLTPETVETQADKRIGEKSWKLGDLIDHYITEDLEIYLYNKDFSSTLYYFQGDSMQKRENLNCDRLQYRDGILWLITPGTPIEAEKLNLATGKSEYFQYTPPKEATEQEQFFINSDGSLSMTYSVYDPQKGISHYAALLDPDGKQVLISAEDAKKTFFPAVFETEEGFAFLESRVRDSESGFFLNLRLLDKAGQEIRRQPIDCTTLKAKDKDALFLENSAACYDGILYFALSDHQYFYHCRYDLATNTLYRDARHKAKGSALRYRILQIDGDKIYTLT